MSRTGPTVLPPRSAKHWRMQVLREQSAELIARASGDWDESLHPRDESGRFGSGGGGSSGGSSKPSAGKPSGGKKPKPESPGPQTPALKEEQEKEEAAREAVATVRDETATALVNAPPPSNLDLSASIRGEYNVQRDQANAEAEARVDPTKDYIAPGIKSPKTAATETYQAAIKADPIKTREQIIAENKLTKEVEEITKRSYPKTAQPKSKGGVMEEDGKTYTAERRELHREILRKVFTDAAIKAATPPPGTKPTLSVFGGRGGSGKSFLTSPEKGGPVNPATAIVLNSDDFKKAFSDHGYNGENAFAFHDELKYLLDEANKMALEFGVNVVHDATLRDMAASAASIEEYKAQGYEVDGYYVFASPNEAATRNLYRWQNDPEHRYVPVEVILDNTTNEQNFDQMKTDFRHWRIYDNNVRGRAPVLIAQGGRKK